MTECDNWFVQQILLTLLAGGSAGASDLACFPAFATPDGTCDPTPAGARPPVCLHTLTSLPISI